jgi:RNA polymerase sigma factor (sigma-70 family)
MIDGLMAHFRHLEKLLRRRGRSREDAEDLIQETFLRVKLYLDEGGKIREPEAFLVRTALNLSRDVHQHEHRHLYSRKPVEDWVLPDAAPTPEEALDTEQRLEQLNRALDKAGPRAREVYLLHRLYGMTYLQIADHFDISQSAVEKHMAKAMMVLGEELLDHE